MKISAMMLGSLSRVAVPILYKIGYVIQPIKITGEQDRSKFEEIYEKCKKYTMTSLERMYSLYEATLYVAKQKIAGDIVECGVWRGGSCMLIALTLLNIEDTDVERKIYLYDTYAGMSEPGDKDIAVSDGVPAGSLWTAR